MRLPASQQVRLQRDIVGLIIEEDWTQTYPVGVDPETGIKPDVYLGGMIMKKIPNHPGGATGTWLDNNPVEELLIVAGSTRGMGTGYGDATGDDEDGFISVVSTQTGQLISKSSNKRIGTGETDLILGICDDPRDPNAFYIVGTTGAEPGANGMGHRIKKTVGNTNPASLHGYVQKIQLDTLHKIWSKSWSAKKLSNDNGEPTVTAGISCHVIDDGSVYVAGMVENGAVVLKNDSERDGPYGDDVFAARFDGVTGDQKWLKQFGSNDGNENLAQGGGIAVDSDQNLIIYGDTTGSLYRAREGNSDKSSDVFLITLSKKDGSHDDLGVSVPHEPTNAPVVTPEELYHQKQWEKFYGTPNSMGGGLWDDSKMGLQSGPLMGSIFAGGMVYNADEDAVYLTGISYGDTVSVSEDSSCMVTKIPLDGGLVNDWTSSIGKSFGTSNVIETCNSVALHRTAEIVAVGSADNGSTFSEDNNVAEYPMVGFALAMDRFSLGEIDTTALVTTTPQDKIQYPISVVSEGDDLYIVSLTSTDSGLSREAEQLKASGGSGDFSPNWINMQKYGKSLDMTVTKITLTEEVIDGIPEGDISFTTRWSKEFPIDPDNDGSGTIPRVYLGGAIVKRNLGYLAVAGSTRGIGKAYGAAVGNDEDGFIALLDLETGEFAGVSRSTIREGSGKDDVVLGICHDPNDDSSFYIVGGTKGVVGRRDTTPETPNGSLEAFVRKVNADTLAEIWTVQWGAIHENVDSQAPTVAKALDCAVDSASGNVVYVGGIVDANARITRKKITP